MFHIIILFIHQTGMVYFPTSMHTQICMQPPKTYLNNKLQAFNCLPNNYAVKKQNLITGSNYCANTSNIIVTFTSIACNINKKVISTVYIVSPSLFPGRESGSLSRIKDIFTEQILTEVYQYLSKDSYTNCLKKITPQIHFFLLGQVKKLMWQDKNGW